MPIRRARYRGEAIDENVVKTLVDCSKLAEHGYCTNERGYQKRQEKTCYVGQEEANLRPSLCRTKFRRNRTSRLSKHAGGVQFLDLHVIDEHHGGPEHLSASYELSLDSGTESPDMRRR